ncbi:FHA domain-containing protein [Anaeromyxobacter oryzae]|uniref:FHA domain-containing protein n=1 Tax=Anaeromyxobacter oryzae TaxID=2918170 RepID=A0ABM7WT50_9BACT|nr:FHA domain-containing protein [Anaeromyxobacter oryzae]BDG02650.1 hypothetical protein AMOR_16460 [Anaeromyxobacter oryzae]
MKLVIEDEAGTRSVVPFTRDEIVVGRAADGVSFRLLDRDVSRRHARFVRSSGAVFVEDLGSLTGTRVNGEKIAGRRRLREGDLVEIGDYDLAVLPDEDAAHAAGAPPPLPGDAAAPAPVRAVPAAAAPVVARAAPAPAPRTIPAPAAAPRARRALAPALVAGLVGLLLGIAAGVAVGLATRPAPAPPAPTAAAPP